ncbi:trace amine-associated receptor 4-like [Cheilinus undulatus]|uniref:trace amine-associated receptor 4-like n=1 Tax=Cheilinus undulatus TaxID=241271 RepID=UPI001BD301A8|nr:trace amine-associated receptor 4-like [Cheilinus undulatus]
MMEENELCFPHLNTSCKKRNSSSFVLIHIMLSFISVLTVILNLLVIISIFHFKKLHTPTNLLLLSLAVSDFFVGLLILFQFLLIDGCWYLGDNMCNLYLFFDIMITSSSVGNMVLISVDRYIAICDPLHYLTKVTVRRASVSIVLCWICSFIYCNILMKEDFEHPGKFTSCSGECVALKHYITGVVDLFFTFIASVTVIIVLYVRVFVVAVLQARVMRFHVAASSLHKSATAKKSEIKAARTLGVVVVVFLVCLCPYFCVALSEQDYLFNASSGSFVIYLFYFNSCLNPLIYAFFYSWFRKSVRLIVTLQILKAGSCEANILQKDVVK